MDNILHLLTDPAAWLALLTLIVMEVVLGIDNLVFVALVSNKLPEAQRKQGRAIGLGLALGLRLALLGTLFFIAGLTKPVLTLFGHDFSWRDLILLAGGLFLVWKATREIHQSVEKTDGAEGDDALHRPIGFVSAIVQILLLDLVFSIDSILTAVGMTDHLPIMVGAVVIAVLLMMAASGPIAGFIHKNPTIVMLALSFLLMIGMALIAEGCGFEVPKGYIYAAMAFSAFVEGLNMLARKRRGGVRNGHD
jgi:predicted tellurium resistance membrane protein TerC